MHDSAPAGGSATSTDLRRPTGARAPIGGVEWLALALLLVVAAVLRVRGLAASGIWLDEGYSLLQTERSLAEIVALRRYDANPPLYLLVLRLWRTTFGTGDLSAKALSALAGIAGVGAVWLAARARFGALAAFSAGLVVALSRFHVHYSQEIRGYALLFAAVALADWLYVRWDASSCAGSAAVRRGARRDLAGWLVASAVAVATHYFAWWMVVVQAACARRRRAALGGVALLLLASTPLLLALLEHVTTFKSQSWIPPADLDALVQVLWLLGGAGRLALLVWALAGLALAVHVASNLPPLLTRDGALPGWRTIAVPALQLALPFLVWLGSLLVLPMLVDRYLLIALLPLACLAGAGVATLRPPALRALVLAVLVVLSVPPLQDEAAQGMRSALRRELTEVIRQDYRDGDVVLYTSKFDFVPIVALHPASMEEYLLPPPEGEEYSTVLQHYTARRVRRDVPRPGEYQRLWLVASPDARSADVAASDWFRTLRPELAWQHPSGLLLRFDLPH